MLAEDPATNPGQRDKLANVQTKLKSLRCMGRLFESTIYELARLFIFVSFHAVHEGHGAQQQSGCPV